MTEQNKVPRGDVRFEQPPVKLVAERADDKDIREENEKLQADHPYPGSCGGL